MRTIDLNRVRKLLSNIAEVQGRLAELGKL